MDLKLDGEIVVVTGASSGIGYSCAEIFLEEGARVAIVSRTKRAHEVAEEFCERFGDRALGIQADLTSPDVGERVFEVVRKKWGVPSITLISGGGPPPASPTSASDSQWREAFEMVVLGPIRVAREAAKRMKRGAAIGFVLSSSVYAPLPELALSNGLRPGLAMFAKDLSDELAADGIRVLGFVPGRIRTERTKVVDSANELVAQSRNKKIPMQRLGEPEEFARPVVVALSPICSYMTGVNLVVDGGMLRKV